MNLYYYVIEMEVKILGIIRKKDKDISRGFCDVLTGPITYLLECKMVKLEERGLHPLSS